MNNAIKVMFTASLAALSGAAAPPAKAPPFPETRLSSYSGLTGGIAVSRDGGTVVAGTFDDRAFVWRRTPERTWPTQPIVIVGAPFENLGIDEPAIDGDDVFFKTGGTVAVYRISGGTATRVQNIDPGQDVLGDSLGNVISVVQPGEIALGSSRDFPPPRLYHSVNGQWQPLPNAQQLPPCSHAPAGLINHQVDRLLKVGSVLARVETFPLPPLYVDVWFPAQNQAWGCVVLPLGLPSDFPKSDACGLGTVIPLPVYMAYLPASNQYAFGANIYNADWSLAGPLALPAYFGLPLGQLASSGNQSAIGLKSNDAPGQVQLFYPFGTSLVPGAAFSAGDASPSDQFGAFVAMGGDTLAVGSSPCLGSPGTDAVYVYDLSPSAVSSVFDAGTQGNWKGKYGQDGYLIANYPGKLSPYATVNFVGASSHTWAASTTDSRALLKGGSESDRIASAFYANSTFTIDLNLTDGQFHQIALYFLDFDTATRNQTVSIRDAYTNRVLDTRVVTNFHNGVYTAWNLQGHVLIQIDNNGGLNAVASGLFFRTLPGPAPSVTITSPLPGNVSGIVPLSASASSPAGVATVQFQLNGLKLFDPAHPSALPGGGLGLVYNWPTRSVANGTYTLTAVAVDSLGQSATSPGVTVTVNNPPPLTTARFVRTDTSTQGAWKGHYGADGEIIANDSNNPGFYSVVNLNAPSLYTWAITQDPRALQQVNSSTLRIASTFYLASSFSIDLNLFDTQPHLVALYFLDWDNSGRAQTVSILDANTMAPLDTPRSLANFQNGQYLVWNVQGHVIINFTRTAGPNAVFSGLFLSPAVP